MRVAKQETRGTRAFVMRLQAIAAQRTRLPPIDNCA
jgi:hypothetical protein